MMDGGMENQVFGNKNARIETKGNIFFLTGGNPDPLHSQGYVLLCSLLLSDKEA